MIPAFQRDSNLPPGIHETDWEELAQRCGGGQGDVGGRRSEVSTVGTDPSRETGRGPKVNPRSKVNPRRERLLLGLVQMLWELAQAGGDTVYIDGSFVTRERWPQDFDVCYETQGIDENRLDAVFFEFAGGRSAQKKRFGGEALPVDFAFDWQGLSVLDAFQRSRDTGSAKGIVRLSLSREVQSIEQFLRDSGLSLE